MHTKLVAVAQRVGPIQRRGVRVTVAEDIGGLINNHTTWRWVFYLNLPVGALLVATLLLGMPSNFPDQAKEDLTQRTERKNFLRTSMAKLDVLGAGLLLSGSLLLATALLEASTRFAWSSGGTVALLVLSGLSWIGFCVWEWHITSQGGNQEPVFPWRFVHDRAWMGMLISTFLMGFPFNTIVVFLPQRFQTVSSTSPLNAGIRLLPYTFGAALGAILANILGSKRRFAVMHILFFGALLQLLGLVLLSTLPTSREFPAKGYGFETLAGVGAGMTFGILVLATPFVASPRDIAVAAGAMIQFRFLGGVIGLSIASSVMNSYLKRHLTAILDADALDELLQSTEVLTKFAPHVQVQVIQVFAQSYNLQYKIMIALAAAQLPAAALMWKREEQIKAG